MKPVLAERLSHELEPRPVDHEVARQPEEGQFAHPGPEKAHHQDDGAEDDQDAIHLRTPSIVGGSGKVYYAPRRAPDCADIARS